MPPEDLVLFRNIPLTDADTAGQTGVVDEPSISNNGQQILVTGNWYASRSLDNGATWDYMSPYNTLPSASGGFCCDQLTLYDASRDLTFWFLQYVKENDSNTVRLAVKRGPTLGNNVWHWWDFTPESVGGWTDEWLDYPDMALSNDFLFVTSNSFSTSGDNFVRSVALKIPLDDLERGETLDYQHWDTTEYGSLRLTRGARDTMYFASNSRRMDRIRVWAWPEDSGNLSAHDVNVTQWHGGDYRPAGPDATNWLERTDDRITGAWVAEGELGFMWTSNAGGQRPNPYIKVARINEDDMTLIDEPDIWSQNATFAYPEACPNVRGHIGVTLFYSSPTIPPSHVVGVRDDYSNQRWDLQFTKVGASGPRDDKWGDYLSCRQHSPDGLTWIATGFTLQGGNSRRDIEPRVVHFGRQRYRRAVDRWSQS
ncbi:MAG: hypothetical protein QF898_11865 [SAR202 cluster bacterium]|jgi:hypothetical protein|nr:hypothetical protein [SAR202 cluster bacterium]MDP6513590.1 hypothetical protein [SAR202 cluster bacterium]MDP6713839.1 hypothetical protein [SAR202 cluster bacterium]